MRERLDPGRRMLLGAGVAITAVSLVLTLSPAPASATAVTIENTGGPTTGDVIVRPDPSATDSVRVTSVEPETPPAAPAVDPDPDLSKRIVNRWVRPSFSAGRAKRAGVAQVVTMRFPIRVQRKRAVLRAIKVVGHRNGKPKRRVKLPPGRWRWINNYAAVYRPKSFWPKKTTIRFQAKLRGIKLREAGRTRYIGGRRADQVFRLKTGRKLVLRISHRSQQMRVLRDGKLIKKMGVSLGRRGWRTRSGIKVITDVKYRKIRMVGGGKSGAGKWDVISPWSVPITTDGEFLHGAPWNRAGIGVAPRSHGCTNLNVADARWIYKRVREGDPVVTKGTGLKMRARFAYTSGKPWAHSWRKWKAMARESTARR